MSAGGEGHTRHLSSFQLEAIRVGAASPEERGWADAHSATCERCAALAGQLDDFRREFASSALPRTRATVRQGVARQRRSRLLRWTAGAFAAPLAVAAVVLVAGRMPLQAEKQDAVLEKGGPSLGIVVRRGARVFTARSGDKVRPGDQIRFVLKGVTYPFGLIASVDGAGKPNIYVPYEGSASAPLAAGERLEMEGSIVLDGRLGPERVFALFSRAPLSAASVRRALTEIGGKGEGAIRTISTLSVPADAQSSVLLEKVAE